MNNFSDAGLYDVVTLGTKHRQGDLSTVYMIEGVFQYLSQIKI